MTVVQLPRKTIEDEVKALPLLRDRKGKYPEACTENVGAILEQFRLWEGVLAYNELTGSVMLMKPIPGAKTPHASFKPRDLRDGDFTTAQRWFQRYLHPRTGLSMTQTAMLEVADQHVISPIRDYLDALIWDGTPRLEGWLTTYLGAEDTPFHRAVGRAWMISAVARALHPGCKVDCALIFEGPQGSLKSAALSILASEAWFSNQLVADLHSKDASSGLRGKWIVELPELSAMKRSDVETVKAYLSRQVEHYRPSYGRNEVSEPRRCVFAGTTNDRRYLRDRTGNRRFWPVPVDCIDLVTLAADRDQLWAEAVLYHSAGEQWHLSREMERFAEGVVETRLEEDPWASALADYLLGKSETSTRECLAAVGIAPADQSRALAMRAAEVIRSLDWMSKGAFGAGPNCKLTRFIRRK